MPFWRGWLFKELRVVLLWGLGSSSPHPDIKVVGITCSQEQMGLDRNPGPDLLWKLALVSATDGSS